ncbi:tyrosine-type recombinase/integrase [Magnetococcales bacterium HHB-1]
MKPTPPPIPKKGQILDQNETRNYLTVSDGSFSDSIREWLEVYFSYEVTTAPSSQKAQKRYLGLFHSFMLQEIGTDERLRWTPSLSRMFYDYLMSETTTTSKRRWSDRSVSVILTHLKTFSKWITQLSDHPGTPFQPFPFGDPMKKIKKPHVGNKLDVSRALTPKERKLLLNAVDTLVATGGLSKDRRRYPSHVKPQRKDYRPYRNRAIVYLLIGSGIRRAGVCNLNLDGLNPKKKTVTTLEKGGKTHTCSITKEALGAVQDYITQERQQDDERWDSPSLFLPHASSGRSNGKLNVRQINRIWSMVCEFAGVEDRTPHSARHSVIKHIVERTGNITAGQKQAGHADPSTTACYTIPTDGEIEKVMEDL